MLRWAALIPADQRPDILNATHWDWPRPFRGISRSVSSWIGPPPVKVSGTAPAIAHADGVYPKPIPDRGQWWLGSPLYFAVTTKGGWHFRIGLRWDDVDSYYAISFTIKKYSGT